MMWIHQHNHSLNRWVAAVLILLLSACHFSDKTPPSYFVVAATYHNAAGANLLLSQTPGAFNPSDIRIQHKVEIGGVVQLVPYNQYYIKYGPITYVELPFLTNFRQKPIETYVILSPTDTDTITYSFEPQDRFPFFPSKVYYNKKQVWDLLSLYTKPGTDYWSIELIK
ncbi:MAG: hypothetical protein U0289_13740 [Cyclobacteriaceae bacterium]|jgi:hypothetical protein|nr:hypothetical protein [Cyclobacteriaceae bacterium]